MPSYVICTPETYCIWPTIRSANTQMEAAHAVPANFHSILQDVKQSLEISFENNREFRQQLLALVRAVRLKPGGNQQPAESDEVLAARSRMAGDIVVENILPDLSSLARDCLIRGLDSKRAITANEFLLLEYTLYLCRTCTDSSAEFSAHLSSCGEAQQLLKSLLNAWTQPHIDKLLDSKCVTCLELGLSTVYNTLWQDAASGAHALGNLGILESASKLFEQSDNDRVVQFAFLILIFLCSDDEAARLLHPGASEQHQDRVGRRLDKLLCSLAKADQTQCCRTKDGFRIEELLRCILQFSRRFAHRQLLAVQNRLTPLKALLQSASERPDSQVDIAISIALSLSLHPACISEVSRCLGAELRCLWTSDDCRWRHCKQLVAVQKLLESFESGKQRRTSNGSSHLNQDGTHESTRPTKNDSPEQSNSSPDVYLAISCSSSLTDIDFANSLLAQLAARDQRAIKLNSHCGSSPQSDSGELIRKCQALILCVSRACELDCMCEFEVKQAVKLQKRLIPLMCSRGYRPGRWLSLIPNSSASTQLIDFTDEKRRTESLSSLISQLSAAVCPPVGHFSGWSSGQVSSWLAELELPEGDRLSWLDGRHLQFLAEVRKEAPEAFYRMLREDLGLDSFLLVFRFVRAMESLQ